MTLERDASGALVGMAAADGRWVRATRDAAGRIVALIKSSGKSRRFAYDARGALTSYTDARGKHRTFTYDHRGRLRGFFDSDGASVRYDYDRAGRLIAVRRGDETEAGSARFIPATYQPPAPSPPLIAQAGCMFGPGDGWFDDGWSSGWSDVAATILRLTHSPRTSGWAAATRSADSMIQAGASFMAYPRRDVVSVRRAIKISVTINGGRLIKRRWEQIPWRRRLVR